MLLAGTGGKAGTAADSWSARTSWCGRKPVVVEGKITGTQSAPEFLHWRQARPAADGFAGKVLTVTLSGPFAKDGLSQIYGALYALPRQIPAGQPFEVTFRARSLSAPAELTVLRSYGGAWALTRAA